MLLVKIQVTSLFFFVHGFILIVSDAWSRIMKYSRSTLPSHCSGLSNYWSEVGRSIQLNLTDWIFINVDNTLNTMNKRIWRIEITREHMGNLTLWRNSSTKSINWKELKFQNNLKGTESVEINLVCVIILNDITNSLNSLNVLICIMALIEM